MEGHFIYKNLIISQHPNIKKYFEKLIDENKPKQILEIGTADGGLTLMIRDILDEMGMSNTTLRTYDILNPINLKSQNREIEIFHQNLFTYPYDNLVDENILQDYISRDGRTIVICDGGSKKNEFRLLSKFLKIDDIIMAHDYAPNEKYFNENIKGKIWNWLEIEDSDIDETCIKYNLHPLYENEFRDVVWVCKIKK